MFHPPRPILFSLALGRRTISPTNAFDRTLKTRPTAISLPRWACLREEEEADLLNLAVQLRDGLARS